MIKIINATYFISVFFSQIISAQEPLELFWEDMVPPDYQAPDTPLSHDGSMLQMGLDAPIVKRLNGKLVKIPGFVVPIEGDNQTTTEFLLVPYFGVGPRLLEPPLTSENQ